MSTFAYSVAIRLSVANLASQGIRLIAKDLLSAHGRAVALGDKLKALKMMAVGYGMSRAGEGIFGFLEKAVDSSKEYTRQISLMNAAGMTHLEVAKAVGAAWATSRDVITSSAADNLKSIRELRTVFGQQRMGEAYSILPTVQRTKAILEALSGREQEGVAFDMVKAIELRTAGTMSAAQMQRNADMMAQTLMGMGGTINVHDYHMALKQARTAGFGLNDEFVYKYLPTLMQEVKTGSGGAQTAGTAVMSAYQAIVSGVLKKSSVPLWEAMGLIAPRDVVRNSGGGVQLRPGAVAQAQLFQANPYAWANQVLAPAVQRYGAAHNLSREQVITGMFGNRMTQWLMNTLIAKAPQFERDRKLIGSGLMSEGTYRKLLQTNPQLAEQAMHAQWRNILDIIGFRILPRLVPLMTSFANTLDWIGQAMARHPIRTDVIVGGLAALASGLTIASKALMTAGLIKFLGLGPTIARSFSLIGAGIRIVALALVGNPIGLAVTAVVALGIAAYELWKHWDTIGPLLHRAWIAIENGVIGFINRLSGALNHILPSFAQIPMIAEAGAQPAPSPFVRPATPAHMRPGDVLLDGKKVGRVMAPHLSTRFANDAARPNQGTTGFDGSGRGLLRVATPAR